MKIVYCCPGPDAGCEKVRRIIDIFVATDSFEIYRSIPEFEKFVRQSLTSDYLIILHASLSQHLEHFVFLRDLLISNKVVLILPDRRRETLMMGHTLRPRFLTYDDGDFLDLASVLCHIINPQGMESKISPHGKI